MNAAVKAMEKVDLASSYDGTPPVPSGRATRGVRVRTDPSAAVSQARKHIGDITVRTATGATRTLHWLWRRVGYWMFRVLSTLNLVSAVLVGVFSQIFAYYYQGALAVQPLIAALFFVPALGAMAVLRENLGSGGTTDSGISPVRSRTVLLAYGAMLVSIVLSFAQPTLARVTNTLSIPSMWLAILGSALFFYCLLISEVLFAAAVNLKRISKIKDSDDAAVSADSVRYGAI